MQLHFTKMHGCGNDYIYFDCTRQPMDRDLASQLAVRLSDRHFGIGGDGIILIEKGQNADFEMVMYNADGSPVLQKNGKQKMKRIYKTITGATKKEVDFEAAQFMLQKEEELANQPKQKKADYTLLPLTELIDKYIESRLVLNRSLTTIQDYWCIQRNGFQDLMQICVKDMDKELLQESVNMESQRPCKRKKGVTLSPKRLQNEWSLLASVIRKYTSSLDDVLRNIELPEVPERVPDLIPAEVLLPAIKDTELELPVLLAAWLSFSMSEIRGLTKSKSISGDHIRIAEVVVVVGGKDHRKEIAKNKYRNRTHRIPPYIKSLIDKVPGDRLVTLTEAQIYHRWIKFQDEHRFKHMTFHDLRHLNASVMAALRIPDKYAQERGGWKSDKIMKKVYTQTFSEVRVAVDDKIDGYFDNIANPIIEKMPWEKYRAWLTLFGKEDNKKSQKEFMKFIEEQKIAT